MELAIALSATFATVALLTGIVASHVMSRTSVTRRRLETLSATAGAPSVLIQAPRLTGHDPGVRKLTTYIPKSPQTMNRLQRKLATAGYHGTRPVVVYCVAEVALAAAGVLAVLTAIGAAGFIIAGAVGFAGYMLPGIYVQRRIKLRRKQIQNGLPDALDLLIVCVEAGLGIDQALLRTADELIIAYPALGEELRLVNIETRAGKPRLEAFRNFAKRTQVEDVRSLVAMLVQTDRFGTSIAQALRTHAEVSRTKRRQRAEEKAAKLGVKLVFPLVFCLIPAFFVVSIGPAIIRMVRLFGSGIGFGN